VGAPDPRLPFIGLSNGYATLGPERDVIPETNPEVRPAERPGRDRMMAPLGPGRDRVMAPLGPGRYRVAFTADTEMHDRLRRAQALLRHRIPSGDIAQILDLALTALLDQAEKRKIGRGGANRRPGNDVKPIRSRHIPAAVRRAVWTRDGGRCAFLGREGRRCGALEFIEFHHVEPFALGGPGTIDNIELRCRAHNVYEAELQLGWNTQL
jgi:hypothetical protein